MPNYKLVATTMFEPYSYERYLQPFQAYSEAYKELEDALADLQVKASVWEGMANELTDPNTYKKYKTYADDLRAQADALASQGLTPTSRRDMLNLRSRYSAEITPIEQAYTQRAELLKAQREALLKDPSLIFERDLSDPTIASLDNFVGNSGYGYGNVYSGEKLREDVSKAAKNLSSTLRSKSESGAELRKLLQMVLPYQYRLLELKGFDSDEVLAAIASDENASSILLNLVEGTIDASGIKDWGSRENVDRARAYAALGLWDAIGTPTEKWLTDTYSMQQDKSKGGKGGEEENTQELPLPLAGYGTIVQDDVKRKASPGIKSLYTAVNNEGNETFDSKYLGADGNTNPMKLYELWDNYKKENINRWAYYNGDPRTLEIEVARVKEEFKKEYNINPDDNIINKDQYKALESLGFTSRDDVSTFTNTDSKTLLEGAAVVYRPTQINLAKYDTPVMERTLSALSLEDFKNNKDLVIDYNTGKTIKPKKLDLEKGVSNTQYDIRYPDRVVLQIGQNRYAVHASMFDNDIKNLLNRAKEIAESGISRALLGELQDEVAKLIQSKLQAFDPVKSETSSKVE